MAKAVYIGNNNSKKVKKMYLGNGTSHKVKKGYIGVDDVAKLFFSGATVWNKYNSNALNTYYWNRYNVNETTYYKWKRYNIETNIIGYKWNKYSISYPGTASLINNRTHHVSRIILGNGSNTTFSIKHYLMREPTTITMQYAYGMPILITSAGGSSLNLDNNAIRIEDDGENATFPFDRYYSVGTDQIRYQVDNLYPKYLGYVSYENGAGHIKYGEVQYTKNLIESVESSNSETYPENGLHTDGYWYEYTGTEEQQVQGSYIDDVESTNSSAYPQNGISGSYWYEYDSSRIEYSRGSANGSVNSTNRSQYPDDGKSGNYWYVYDHMNTTYSQGSYIGIVENDDPNAYPDNGRHTDGYWYVKQNE